MSFGQKFSFFPVFLAACFIGCNKQPTPQLSSASATIEKVSAPKVLVQKNGKTDTSVQDKKAPAFLGRWTLDHNAYRLSPAFQALTDRQKRSAVGMLNRVQTDMTITPTTIEKTGRFNGRQVASVSDYSVIKKTGEVWLISVKSQGKTREEKWRMNATHLVVTVDEKERVYSRATSP